MAKGTYSPDGTITITYNPLNSDRFFTPDGHNHYLPCERCGEILVVPTFVVSVICTCAESKAVWECNNRLIWGAQGRPAATK